MDTDFRPQSGRKLELARTRRLDVPIEDQRQPRIDVSPTADVGNLNGFRPSFPEFQFHPNRFMDWRVHLAS
jgi:hypothetical protein